MYKKSLVVGIFLLALMLFIGAVGLTAEAGITVVDGARTITLTDGHYDINDINNTVDDGSKLWNQSNGVWLSNYSIIVDADATLELNPNATGVVGCSWLKLNNYTNVTWTAHINVTESTGGGVGGRLFVNDTMITGWNHTDGKNTSYVNLTTLRPWIFVHGGYEHNSTEAYFLNSTLGYLGYNQSDRYGIVYKDINTSAVGHHHYPLGWMHNCTVLENYIGIAFQGVKYMNVTNSIFNDSKEAGIVYTSGTTFGSIAGPTEVYYADYGYIGDNKNSSIPCSLTTQDGVTVRNISGTTDPDGSDGIRIYYIESMELDDVDIFNCTNMGLRVTGGVNLTVNNTLAYNNGNASEEANIYLSGIMAGSFTNSTAHTTTYNNWHLLGASSYNNFTDCRGYLGNHDFEINTSGTTNLFMFCIANNSDSGFFSNSSSSDNWFMNCTSHDQTTAGFYGYGDDNDTFMDCIGHDNGYDFYFQYSVYNNIICGYANDSGIGVYIIDVDDAQVSHHNTVLGLDVNNATSYAVSIGSDGGSDTWSHNNTIDSVRVYGTTDGDGIFFFDNVTCNNATNCFVTDLGHANSCAFGMSNDAHHNIFHGSLANDNENTGFILMETANNNSILGCTAALCEDGLNMSGDNVHDNTINDFYSHHNDWGLWAWSSASNNNNDNYVNNSRFQFNTYAGIDIGRVGLSTYYNNTVKNNSYGVEVRDGAEAFFTMTLSYNSTYYDWVIEDTSAVDIYSTHILYPNVINTVGPVTASISHDAGVGLWNLYTKPMIITTDEGVCNITVTQYTDTYVQWTGTAAAGNLTQYIGSLREGRVYDLLVNGASVGRASAAEVTMLENTTYRVTFPYTDGWSTKTFAVRMITGGGNGGVPLEEEEPGLDSDGDGYTDAEEIAAGSDPYDPASTPLTVAAAAPSFLGVEWYWWIVIAVIIFFFIIALYFALDPKAWKKFKKSLGF